MIGSQAAGAWIAQLVFWAVIGLGVFTDSLNKKVAAVFVALWIAGYFGLPRISWGLFITPYVAVVDIVLVFLVFKGDIRLS